MVLRITRGRALIGLAGLLALGLPPAQATTVNVRVTVLSPPCIINGGRPIEVDFGDEVMTTRIDGVNYRRAVSYTLTCSGQSSNGLKLQVQGTASGFDGQLLRTSKDGLGIALMSGGRRWPINQWLNFTYPTAPTLEAVPVKSATAKLAAGEFTAGATMKVDYQ
ncbi:MULTISPECIES: fimbrial protein [Serratia]|jgi:type 1 fimbria pilin|uniref:Fimbrial protein n=1 Tax=Serratia surfactantfaciens TaxID=2741499 RepID=A0ABS0LZL4_9GAMM|nr:MULTISPECIES: fimbrial protein [Serratia]WMW59873.1 fimbrial protein [Serratia marcescens]AOE99969.1 exotoxin [Serratia surfactantfaciens]MBH1920755.1 fimbrial protein [Serratia surfactantfaciens]MTD06084.1 fimbrial protein [Serratia sp. YC16]BEM87987.1 exotoxin [Serratia marcescens]